MTGRKRIKSDPETVLFLLFTGKEDEVCRRQKTADTSSPSFPLLFSSSNFGVNSRERKEGGKEGKSRVRAD